MSPSRNLPNVPGYRLLRPIGAGGMGSVYEGEKLSTHETFAIKLIREHLTADASYITRFEREISVLRGIRHPNVVDVFEWSFGDPETGLRPYVVMELLEGESVDQLVRRERILFPSKAVGIMLQALEGLAAAHAQGVLHRDLGPSNIFIVTTASGKLSVKLLDFGLARVLLGGDAGRAVTQEGTLMGKPAYVSPEHFLGKPLDERADLYACGMVLFRMLAGRLPYKATDAQMLWVERWAERDATNELPSVQAFVPDLPDALAKVVARALRRNPDQRYRGAREMQAELLTAEQTLEEVTTARLPGTPHLPLPGPSAMSPSPSPRVSGPVETHSSTVMGRSTASLAGLGASRRSVALAAALVIFAAIAVVLAIRFAIRSPSPPTAPPVVAAVPVLPPPDAAAPGPVEPAAAKTAAPGPDAGLVPVAPVAPLEPVVPVAPVEPAVPTEPAPVGEPVQPDPGSGHLPAAVTVHFSFAGLPGNAAVSVGGRSVDPRSGINLPRSGDAVLVVVNVPGSRFERWGETFIPDRDRTIQPELRLRAGSDTGSPPPPPRADAGTTVAVQPPPPPPPPADAGGGRVRDAGGPAMMDGRMGTSFVTTWGD
jgi:serine/threonine-protein kinase